VGVVLLPVDYQGCRRRGISSVFEAMVEGVARPRSSPRFRGALVVRRGKIHRTGGRGRDTYATGTAVTVVGCGRCERCDQAGWWCGVRNPKARVEGRGEGR
jgi:hypothetical protein